MKNFTNTVGFIIILNLIGMINTNLFAAETPAKDIGDVFNNLGSSFDPIVVLFFSIAIIAGLSFGYAGVTKFKQFKDNPAQVSIGQPIGLCLLAVMMIWLPFIIKSMGYSLTGAKNSSELKQDQSTLNSTTQSGFGKYLINK